MLLQHRRELNDVPGELQWQDPRSDRYKSVSCQMPEGERMDGSKLQCTQRESTRPGGSSPVGWHAGARVEKGGGHCMPAMASQRMGGPTCHRHS